MKNFKARNRKWWTRERVINGLHRFYKDFGFTPTSSADYQKYQQFTGKMIGRTRSDRGYHQKYPSYSSIANYFGSMRQAWHAAGFDVDKSYEEWAEIEDWFVVESCGILPRREVARILKRTEAAVKRRLYDLGRITANERWGMSVNRAATLMNIGGTIINRYILHGILPVFRGNKNIYLNPADLVLIAEFDWSAADVNPELENHVRRALIHRLAKILKYGTRRRNFEIYKTETKKVYLGRVKKTRQSPLLKNTPVPPNDLQAGDWVKTAERCRQIAAGRVGRVKNISFSAHKVRRKDGSRRACWMAFLEFPKLKQRTDAADRVHYSLPLDALLKADAPENEKTEPDLSREAVRARTKRDGNADRVKRRFGRIRDQLT